MNFILRMAWRDSRASRRRLLLFSLSIVLGIAALVAIGSFNANLRRAIDGQARTLLGADLEVTSRAALSDEAETFLASLGGGAGAGAIDGGDGGVSVAGERDALDHVAGNGRSVSILW